MRAWILPWGLCVVLTACGDRAPRSSGDADASAPSSASQFAQPSTTTFARNAAGAFVARHSAQRVTTTIDQRGATLASADLAWQVGLHVARVGREGDMRAVTSAAPSQRGARVELARGSGVTEWFARDPRGVEHGVDVATRPTDAGPLVVEVDVEAATPHVRPKGRVTLRDARGVDVLSYEGLVVMDAEGRSVPASLSVRDGTLAIRVTDAGARYPIAIDPLVLAKQQAELLASDGTFTDGFGFGVAISGTTALVGAFEKRFGSASLQGAAYVFAPSGASWTQQQKLVADDGAVDDQFGCSVAVSGTTAIIGAYSATIGSTYSQGAAYIFAASGAAWTQQAKLVAADGTTQDDFGYAVAISGATAVVGAPTRGAAYVFTRTGSTWTQQAKLTASNGVPGDLFGGSVGLSGTTAIVGASGNDPPRGAAYVYAQSGGVWTEQAKLLDGGADDRFGSSVAISGDTAVVGAYGGEAAYVYAFSGGTWGRQAKLVPSGGAFGDDFGWSITMSGDTVIVGAPRAAVGSINAQGAAYVFGRDAGGWTQQAKLAAADGAVADAFGSSVALSDTTAVVGAWTKTFGGNTQQGAAYVYGTAHTNGDACGTAGDCLSGICTDGVCCDRACTSLCEACDVSGSSGTCTAVTGQPHNSRPPCGGTGLGTICGQACNGVDTTRCTYATATTACSADTCSGGTATHTGSCNFAGRCIFATSTCGVYACDATACKTTCAAMSDCAAGFHCAGSTCVPLDGLGKACADGSSCAAGLSCTDGVCCGVSTCGVGSSCALPSAPGVCRKRLGTVCATAGECDSNVCVDGVCCNSTCAAQCTACDAKGAEGTCTLIVGAPHGARAACATGSPADPCLAATCDGVSATSCGGLPSSAVSCRQASCIAGVQTFAANCTGKGSCEELQTKKCEPYACGATQCKTVCGTDADCAKGNSCDVASGRCIDGSTCDGDHTVTSPTGNQTDCSPLKCAGSVCLTGCTTTNDCVAGATCDSASKACVEQGTTTSGSGCAASASRSLGALPTFALAALAGLGQWRRRRHGRRR